MRVEIIDITDASSSMESLRKAVIDGFNGLVKEQQSVPGEARLSHVQFSHQYLPQFVGVDINSVVPLTQETYRPGGYTALLDAIGRTLNEHGQRIATEGWADKVIVCIRTDGEENSSKEYTKERVKEMIEHAQKHGWEFIFSAANQDAFSVGASYGISGANTSNFVATASATMDSYAYASSVLRSARTVADVVIDPLSNHIP